MKHTDRNFENELQQLKSQILKMGGAVENMIHRSFRALMDRDSEIARQVIQQDDQVNELEIDIHERCVQVLALHQPAASDLRFITIGLRISTDLERMGDLAVNIAERVLDLNQEPQLKPYVDLPAMAERTEEMVHQSLDAFVKQDANLAQKVLEMDDHVDQLNKTIHKDLILLMEKEPASVKRAVWLILISRHLERMADHSTNIAEEVIFMVKGKDVRHGASASK